MEPNIKVTQLSEEEAHQRSAFTQSIITRCDNRVKEAEDHSLYTALYTMLWTFLACVNVFTIWYIVSEKYNIMMNLSDASSSYYDLYDTSMWLGIIVGVLICSALVCIGKIAFYIKNAK